MKAVFKDNSILKNVVDLIKDVVTSANFKCTPEGIFMQAMDSSHVSMASFSFYSDMFSFYECNETIDLGVDLNNLFKILKVIVKDDYLGFETLKEDQLSVQIKNPKTEKEWYFDLKLMDIESEEMEIPDTPTGWQVVFSSDEFAKNISTMAQFGDSINVGTTDGKLLLMADGEMSNATLSNNANCEWVENKEMTEMTGEHIDKHDVKLKITSRLLSKYGAGKNLSKEVIIHVSPDCPIMIKYPLTEQSQVFFFIAPKMDDDDM
jgi:proliferating cell nuclear antigen